MLDVVVPSFRRCCIGLVFVAAASSPLFAQAEVWTTSGEARSDRLGHSVAIVPDVDGDGRPDVLVGAPGGDVFFAGPSFALRGRATVRSSSTGAVLREWLGSVVGDQFGARVADVGDTDGDGSHDYGVAAPRHPTTGYAPGALFVYSGADGSLLHALLNNSPTFAEHGTDVAGIGDVDGDGGSDFVSSNVGFDFVPSNEAVSVVSGRTGATIRTHFGTVSFTVGGLGLDLDGAGDVDGDQVADYVVGAPFEHWILPSENGVAFVYSGASGALLWILTDPGHYPGYSGTVSGAGDVDGDGFADLLVGGSLESPGFSWGVVNVHSGATGAVIATATGANGDRLGDALCETDDVDGDSIPDFVATASARPTLRAYSGASGALIGGLDLELSGLHAVDAADVTGDGVFDVVAGFPQSAATDQLAGAGRLVVVDGASGALVADVFGIAFKSRCGESFAIVADRDGDGHREVAIGLPGGLGSNVGTVRIVSGATGVELALLTSGTPLDEFGAALASVGDLDGDGVDELAVGAPGFQGAGRMELRSGADDSLLSSIAAPAGAVAFGSVLAAAVDASGGSFLAIGDPGWNNGTDAVGLVEIRDLVNGTTLSVAGTTNAARFGAALAGVGDANGDGVIDWIVGEPGQDSGLIDSGRVHLVSGSDGSVLWQQDGSRKGAECGTSVAGLGDLDGDGVGDVLAGCPAPDGRQLGRALAWSGRDGTLLFALDGASNNDLFGSVVAHLGDLNGDGKSDFAVGAARAGYVLLISGATATTLYRFDGLFGFLPERQRLGSATWGRDTRVDGDDVPDLLVGLPALGEEEYAGIAALRRLAPLFLQVIPTSPVVGLVASAETRGGPAGNLGALFVVEFDGTAMFELLTYGTFEALGNWSVSDVVPPSLSGHSFVLRSYTIGFTGEIVATQDTLVVVS